ncbi:MAG: hypothetical protein HY763_04750 [Planctomycetes bacterium]|nr:hypothetical protein [Planctomycetota bacterium]
MAHTQSGGIRWQRVGVRWTLAAWLAIGYLPITIARAEQTVWPVLIEQLATLNIGRVFPIGSDMLILRPDGSKLLIDGGLTPAFTLYDAHRQIQLQSSGYTIQTSDDGNEISFSASVTDYTRLPRGETSLWQAELTGDPTRPTAAWATLTRDGAPAFNQGVDFAGIDATRGAPLDLAITLLGGEAETATAAPTTPAASETTALQEAPLVFAAPMSPSESDSGQGGGAQPITAWAVFGIMVLIAVILILAYIVVCLGPIIAPGCAP